MIESQFQSLTHLLGHMFKAHPWHGLSIGSEFPGVINAYIEIVPTDTVKFELDKDSGHLRVDRPQRFSNICPMLYGLVPQTYCGEKIAEFCRDETGRPDIQGDNDPLDICILSEKDFSHGDFTMEVVPIGGLRMIDGNEADDKIIAVLRGDAAYGHWTDISDCPTPMIDRLIHYFLTYKDAPHESPKVCEVDAVYGAEVAHDVIRRSQQDYHDTFPDLEQMLNLALGGHG